MTAYHEREIVPALLDALESMPVVVLTGMRQVGKSTLLQKQEELKHRTYVSLDDFARREEARANPEAFLREEALTIDEVQKCPELLEVIKQAVDRDRKPGRFLLSGSANLLLLGKVTESLAGRAVYLTLHPFNRREIHRNVTPEPFILKFFKGLKIPRKGASAAPLKPCEIVTGGMPSVCLQESPNASLWFRGFEQTYLERDVRELSQIADLVSFRRLLHLATFRAGQLLNASELARDAGMKTATVSRYLNLMEVSFVIRRLIPYLSNPSSRLIKSPKLFFSDSGLACHLAGIEKLAPSPDEPLRGAMFENYVLQNLSAILEAHAPGVNLYFWNIQGRHEVDLVLEKGRELLALELKAASRWNKRDFSGLRAFLSSHPRCKAGILAYNGMEAVQLEDRLWAIPLGLLLS